MITVEGKAATALAFMFKLKLNYSPFRGSIVKWFRSLKLQQYILPPHLSSIELK